MKRFFLALLIAVLGNCVFIPVAFLCEGFQNTAAVLMGFLVLVVSFATMIILDRIKKYHEALIERLDELEKQIKNKDKTN